MKRILMAATLGLAAVLGCTGPMGINAAGGSGGAGASSGSGNNGTGGAMTTSGLPCDVAAVLSSLCTSCHGNPPTTGTPMPLLSYANLTAQKGGKSYAQLSVERMASTTAPMPPGGGATAADIAVLQAWIDAGLPQGTCGEVDGGTPDPTFQGEPTCPSGQFFDPPPDVEDAKAMMYPGQACIKCHSSDEGPVFKIAGTVFDKGKVLDDCLPPAVVDMTQAKVVITDMNGVETTLSVNKNGNFHSGEGPSAIVFPYQAKVVYQGKERVMAGAQTNGDCNVCHTGAGAQNAPGRIALPN